MQTLPEIVVVIVIVMIGQTENGKHTSVKCEKNKFYFFSKFFLNNFLFCFHINIICTYILQHVNSLTAPLTKKFCHSIPHTHTHIQKRNTTQTII